MSTTTASRSPSWLSTTTSVPTELAGTSTIASPMFWSSRGRRKQETKRKEMLASLKKGDKVTSIGGIVGTIIEVRDDEVVAKIDDNVRVRFARWAIRGTGEEAKTTTPEQKN